MITEIGFWVRVVFAATPDIQVLECRDLNIKYMWVCRLSFRFGSLVFFKLRVFKFGVYSV